MKDSSGYIFAFVAKSKLARRRPVQDRSRATVEVILEAAIQVFSARGYAETTTTRIAERAGVSVGSLYQYFPNKDAVLAALWERHSDEAHAELLRVLEDPAMMKLSARGVMRRLAEAMIDLHLQNPRLHRILSEEVPPRSTANRAKARAEKALFDRAVRLFREHPRLNVEAPERVALLVGQLLESFSHWYVLEGPPLELDAGAFADEIAALATACLRRHVGPSGRAGATRPRSGTG